MTVRVVLVDDQPLFRGAVAALLARQPGMEVVGEADDGRAAIALVESVRPDLVIMDVEMPVMDGVEAVAHIRAAVPEAKVIMLTVSGTDEHVRRAMANGAHGYLLKNLHPHQLFELVDAVMAGATPIAPAPEASGARPTPRELSILRLVADGLSNREIAQHLAISEGTVKSHVQNVFEKLGLANRTQAAAYVIRQGLGDTDGPQL